MADDGKLDPLDGLSSPVGLGTLAIALALTEAVQSMAGKDGDQVIRALESKRGSTVFENGGAEAQKIYKETIEKAIEVAKKVQSSLG